jgi:hypothetical protein
MSNAGAWSQAADPATEGQGEDDGEAELRQWRLRHDFSVFEVPTIYYRRSLALIRTTYRS